jgi:hypothetical protein
MYSLSSWWWAEKPPETCRALTPIRILYNVASCWLYLKEYIKDARYHERQKKRLMHGSTWPVTSLSYPVCSAVQRSFTSLKGFLFHVPEIPLKWNWSQWTTSLVLTGESEHLLVQRFPVIRSHPAHCTNYTEIIFRKITKSHITHLVTNYRDIKLGKV